VLTVGSADVFAPKAVRATTGSITHLPLVVDVTIDEVVDACRAVGQRLVGLDLTGDADVFAPGVVDPPVALVFGNEAHGLPPAVASSLDVRTRVPMFGRAESLNLAAAVAVTVYEAARRTQDGG
jgi:RNA methyltransferase, TrmH family